MAAEDDQLELSNEQELLFAGGWSQERGGWRSHRGRRRRRGEENRKAKERGRQSEREKERRRRGSPISVMDLCLTWSRSCIPHMQGGSRGWSLQPQQKVLEP